MTSVTFSSKNSQNFDFCAWLSHIVVKRDAGAGLNTYFRHNLPPWKVCLKIYCSQQKISLIPKLKEAYFLLVIITNSESHSLQNPCPVIHIYEIHVQSFILFL